MYSDDESEIQFCCSFWFFFFPLFCVVMLVKKSRVLITKLNFLNSSFFFSVEFYVYSLFFHLYNLAACIDC